VSQSPLITNSNSASPAEEIASYISAMKGSGHFLSHLDCQVIQKWLKITEGRPDPIFLVLDEHLGDHFKSGKMRPLSLIESKISRMLRNASYI
jgi:hypothetical protein